MTRRHFQDGTPALITVSSDSGKVFFAFSRRSIRSSSCTPRAAILSSRSPAFVWCSAATVWIGARSVVLAGQVTGKAKTNKPNDKRSTPVGMERWTSSSYPLLTAADASRCPCPRRRTVAAEVLDAGRNRTLFCVIDVGS